MVERRLTGMIAAAAVLIVLFVFWDAFKPTPRRVTRDPDANAPLRIAEPPPAPASPLPQQAMPPTPSSQGTAVPAGPDGREPSYIELLARSETRRRIRSSGSSTYLGEMLETGGDSTLRRWENRTTAPIHVWFAPTHAANFQPAFIEAIKRAFGLWTNAGVPVRFDFEAASTNAEVTVKWRIQFEIERTGQTDVTWDENGHIQGQTITLATFDPKGRPMDSDDIRIVATHEARHVLGLAPSKASTDLMFPTATGPRLW